MIFGHLLTGSNFNDEEKKVTGGRNGFGAKLTNIYSTKFTVHCADSSRGKEFKMTWRDNMYTKNTPTIKDFRGRDFVKITFVPDFARFQLRGLDEAHLKIFKKRVYDLCGVIDANVKVHFNGERIAIKNFSEYVNFYLGPNTTEIKEKGNKKKDSQSQAGSDDKPEVFKVVEKSHRWEVIVSISDNQFQQVSFVNSICTLRGGTHVQHITDQIVKRMMDDMQKKNKKTKLQSHQIRTTCGFLSTAKSRTLRSTPRPKKK